MTRILKFVVKGQIIEKDPKCDFSDLVAGSEGYLKVELNFSSEWDSCIKVVEFTTGIGSAYTAVLKDGMSCDIPPEVCKRKAFKLRVVGQKPDGYRIGTNKIIVKQNGGAV